MCEKENQPFLKTQSVISEIFKCVMGFCAMKYDDAINSAFGLVSQDMTVISYE